MKIDTEALLPLAEANRNFSKVVKMVDEHGMIVILRNNKPRYVVVEYNEYEEIRVILSITVYMNFLKPPNPIPVLHKTSAS